MSAGSAPRSSIAPAVGSTKRSSVASTVALPAPEGPVSATRAPGGICREKPSSAGASRWAYSTRSDSMVRAGGAAADRGGGGTDAGEAVRRGAAGAGGGAGGARDSRHRGGARAGRGRLPLGGGVELGSRAAQRYEDLRRHQQHGQGGLEPELAPQQTKPEDHRDQADAESRDEVHGEGGEEGHPQCAHRGLAHSFGRGGHLASALGGAV